MFDQTHYQCEHRKIFDAYREKYKNRSSCLFEDGVVDPSNYQGILFLLKEAYSKDQTFSEWNLVSNLAEKGPWGMWNHVCMWTHGIEHTTNNRIEPFRDLTEEEKCCALSHLAIINVKKANGTSTSSDSDLQGYVVENKELLCKEVLGVQPKIIVCGNTFRYTDTKQHTVARLQPVISFGIQIFIVCTGKSRLQSDPKLLKLWYDGDRSKQETESGSEKQTMYGAILGDIIGSPYEFDRGDKTKDFPLFGNGAEFTDDTVMTIAVAEAFWMARICLRL